MIANDPHYSAHDWSSLALVGSVSPGGVQMYGFACLTDGEA